MKQFYIYLLFIIIVALGAFYKQNVLSRFSNENSLSFKMAPESKVNQTQISGNNRNSTLRLKSINKQDSVKITVFPKLEDIFLQNHEEEKYVFMPLVSVEFTNHKILGTRTFCFISLWDTGTYESDYLNNFRLDNYIIRFKYVNNKYSYPPQPKFPFIKNLKEAYKLIEEDFAQKQAYFLTPKKSIGSTLSDGGEMIHNKIPELNSSEADYYYERIIKYLYVKKKFEKFGKVYPDFTYSTTFVKNQEDEEKMKLKFNTFGKDKSELINNLLGKPEWIQSDETPDIENIIFIGSVSEYDFTNGTAEIYLFFDAKNEYVYQIFQWT